MRTTNTMMSLLLLSAVFISPASANWFSNPKTGAMLNVGSDMHTESPGSANALIVESMMSSEPHPTTIMSGETPT